MPYRINGQYIMEGLGASFMFCLGGENFYLFLKNTIKNKILIFQV